MTRIDLDHRRLHVAREHHRDVREILGLTFDARLMDTNLFDLKDTAGFDLIWMGQAFHHVEPRSEVPWVLSDLSRPGVHVVISEANGRNPALQLLFLRRRGLQTVEERVDEKGKRRPDGSERFTSAGRIGKRFASHGLAGASRRHYRVFPSSPVFERLARLED